MNLPPKIIIAAISGVLSLNMYAKDVTLSFNKDTNLKQWHMGNVASKKLTDKGLELVTKKDAALITNMQVNASEVNSISITMQSDKKDVGQLFFKTNGNYNEKNSFRFTTLAGTSPKTYTILVSGNPGWKDKITGIRFDPVNVSGANIIIKEIRLQQSAKLEWVFSSSRKLCGWHPNSHIKNIKYGAEGVSFSSSKDPYLTRSVKLKASTFKKLIISMKTDKSSALQFFFAEAGKQFSEKSSIKHTVAASPDFQSIEIDLTKNKFWTGKIANLRLDPVATKDSFVSIKSITLE